MHPLQQAYVEATERCWAASTRKERKAARVAWESARHALQRRHLPIPRMTMWRIDATYRCGDRLFRLADSEVSGLTADQAAAFHRRTCVNLVEIHAVRPA